MISLSLAVVRPAAAESPKPATQSAVEPNIWKPILFSTFKDNGRQNPTPPTNLDFGCFRAPPKQ